MSQGIPFDANAFIKEEIPDLYNVERRRRPNRKRFGFEKRWPENVWCVGQDRLDLLGVDDDGNLYWDGAPIEMKRPLTLTVWQRIGAGAIAVSAVVAAIAAALSAYVDMAGAS